MITTNQKKIAALAALGLLWGGILASEWLTIEEPVRVPLTNVSGSGSTTRGTRGAVDGLHVQLDLLAAARTQREMTFTPPRNIFAPPLPDDSGLLAQTGRSSNLGRGRHCLNKRRLPDWPNSIISGLCAWRMGQGRRANWLCSRRMTISISSGPEKL